MPAKRAATTSAARPRPRRRAEGDGRSASPRREQLLAIAAEVFAQRGFRSATVRDIGDAAGILSGSLYHHFVSKEQILEELLAPYLERLTLEYRAAALPDAPAAEVFTRMVTAGLRTVARDHSLAHIVHNEYAYLTTVEQFAFVADHYHAIQKLWIDVIRQGQSSGEFRPDLKPPAVYRLVMGSLLSSIRWHTLPDTATSEETAREMADILLGGITAP